jgi:hypothetical protein
MIRRLELLKEQALFNSTGLDKILENAMSIVDIFNRGQETKTVKIEVQNLDSSSGPYSSQKRPESSTPGLLSKQSLTSDSKVGEVLS